MTKISMSLIAFLVATMANVPIMAQTAPTQAQNKVVIDPTAAKRVAEATLRRAPVIDGHNDLAEKFQELYANDISKVDLRQLPPDVLARVHTDIPSMRAGHLGGQFWSVYVDANLPPLEGTKALLEQIDTVDRIAAAYPDTFRLVTNVRDFEAAMKAGKVASFKGAEGGGALVNSPALLRQIYALGVRYLTLTHNRTVDWADSCCDTPRSDGLSPAGVAMVREMNRIGMLIDLSHTSEATMMDALDATRAPVMLSHSNARAINNHPRNVPDSVLRRLPQNGGIVMVTFVPGFLSQKVRDYNIQLAAQEAELKARFLGNPDGAKAALAQWQAANPSPTATINDVADHIDHIRQVAGIDHIGVGGDFGGVDTLPDGLGNVSAYPALFAELARRGYTTADMTKISQGNILRVMRAAEATRGR